MAHEQSEQRSEQKASAQEAAMAVMMAMAAVATKDHVPQGQDTKQTQHFSFLRFVVSYVPVIRYGYRIKQCISEKQD